MLITIRMDIIIVTKYTPTLVIHAFLMIVQFTEDQVPLPIFYL